MSKIIFCNLSDNDNAGDRFSCPIDYFPFENAEHISINQIKKEGGPIVFGGGGLLHEGFLKTFDDHATKQNVLWGIGINEHDINKQYFPTYINHYGLAGIRDWGNPWTYVPCVSCMDRGFDYESNPVDKFVVYEHKDVTIPINCQHKRSNKLCGGETLTEILKFLRKGDVIITNSYHGAYWGLLCNRKVLIFEPFSNRFLGFKYQPTTCDRNNWTDILNKTINHPISYLNECREINQRFYQETLKFLI